MHLRVELGNNVWHGSDANGFSAAITGETCSNWSTSSFNGRAMAATNSNLNYSMLACSSLAALYCMGDASAAIDTNPTNVDFLGEVSYVAGTRISSNIVTITGINQNINVSVSAGAGNPQLKINGGAEVTSGTATLGDTIQVVMDAPVITGTKNTATITLGDDTNIWTVGYADSSVTARIFVTSTQYKGDLGGGIGGADNICQSLAASGGYSGTWKAFLPAPSSGGSIRNRTNFNWGSLTRIDGVMVATSWNDLWDGSITNPIQIDETGATTSAGVWTGSNSNGSISSAGTCEEWSSGSISFNGRLGSSSASASSWLNNSSDNCANNGGAGHRIYCIENDNVPDTTPTAISFTKRVTYVSGERLSSGTQTIKGIKGNVSVSVTGPAGNPQLKINGGAEVTSGTANWGDTVEIVMDAPTVVGTLNTATLTVGTSSFTWSVGYADNSKVAKVFVTNGSWTGNSLSTTSDSKCQSAATAAGLGGTWTAIISMINSSAKDRIPWNWGTLKKTNGQTVVTGYDNIWTGSLSSAIDRDEYQNYRSTSVWTGSSSSGNFSGNNCNDWVSGWPTTGGVGLSTSASSAWLANSNMSCSDQLYALYCIDSADSGEDLTPNAFTIPYKLYQANSARVESDPVTITGITAPATVTLVGAQGSPAIKINGGAELPSGSSINNGDSLQIVMTTPASENQSHKVEVQIGNGSPVPWRVWAGNPTSGVRKRVFVTSTTHNGNLGGLTGADNICQTRASSAGLSGTWKAIISGDSTIEHEWAINRIGYAGSELWSMGAAGSYRSRVVEAANLWKNSPVLETPIQYNESGTFVSTNLNIATNSNPIGQGINSACMNWSTDSFAIALGYVGNASGQSAVWTQGSYSGSLLCNGTYRLYCIEQ